METKDRHTTREKRLPYRLLVAGLLASCLTLSVAAQTGNRRGGPPLHEQLARIEKRLRALEQKTVSRQPSASAMSGPGSSFAQIIPEKISVIEQQLQSLKAQVNQAGGTSKITAIEQQLQGLTAQVSSLTAQVNQASHTH